MYGHVQLLPFRSEEREVLGIGIIPVVMLLSCQYMKTVALELHKHEYSWVVRLRNTLEAVPHTAPSMFLYINILSLPAVKCRWTQPPLTQRDHHVGLQELLCGLLK